MDKVLRRLDETRKQRGLTWAELARRIGATSDRVLYNWRHRNHVPAEWRRPLARALDVSLEWLETGSEPNVSDGPDLHWRIPRISWVQAGTMSEAVDVLYPGEGYEWVPTSYPPKEHTFALRIEGDSMEPTIQSGQVITCEPDMQPEVNDIVIVRNGDDEATCKRLIKDGSVWMLKADNPRYPLREMSDDMTVVAVVRDARTLFR